MCHYYYYYYSISSNIQIVINSRDGTLVQALMPKNENALAFQIGETAQIHSGKYIVVVSHLLSCQDRLAL
jgi:hypothetical protein